MKVLHSARLDRDVAPRAASMLALALMLSSCHGKTTPSATPPAVQAPPDDGTRAAAPAPRSPAARQVAGGDDPPPAFFSELVQRADALSREKHREPQKISLPSDLSQMRYDAYRSIRFRPEASLWRDQDVAFEAQFFHPGFYYQEALGIFELGSGGPEEVPFATSRFVYDRVPAPPPEAQLTYTGFRLHTALNQPNYKDEVIVFQGASYFRPLGKGTVYGLSARGLAIDLGEPKVEEFPRFSEFYLVRPQRADDAVWVLALLESRSATGAYAFHVAPGDPTVVTVTAELFVRSGDAQLGLAPLSSMYLFGEEGPNRFGDFRPEVHDSDGLSLWLSDGEWLLRPLRNPPKTTVCSFRADRLRGFGLVQRDRDFSSYQDLETRYEARPSLWVEPITGFGAGAVRLLEIATDQETDDNIAVAFQPDTDTSMSLRYRLHVGLGSAASPPGAIVHGTRITKTKRGTRFIVDFAGQSEAPASEGGPPVELVLTTGSASVLEQHVETHERIRGHRASFELDRAASDVELRAFLRRDGGAISETWSYLWQPTP